MLELDPVSIRVDRWDAGNSIKMRLTHLATGVAVEGTSIEGMFRLRRQLLAHLTIAVSQFPSEVNP